MTARETVKPIPELYEKHPIETWLSTSSLQRPTAMHSVLNNFMKGVVGNVALGTDVESVMLGERTEGNKEMHDAIDLIDAEQKNENRVGTEVAGFAANMAGQVLTLLPLAGERLIGGAAKYITQRVYKPLLKVVPILAKKIPILTLQGIEQQSIAKTAALSTRYGASFAGFTAPEALDMAYDEKTNSFNYRQASLEIGLNGALGASIPAAQFLLGLLGKRLGKSLVKEIHGAPPEAAIDLTGLSKEHQDWVKDYIKNPESNEVHEKAVQLVKKEGYEANSANHKVAVKLLTENNAENLDRVLTDAVFADLPEDQKLALRDHIINGRIDELGKDKHLADGLMGAVEHIDNLIEGKELRLAEAEKDMFIGIQDNMKFSQSGILRNLEKAQFEKSHVSHIPYTIPENLHETIKLEQKIRELEAKNKKFGENKKVTQRIEQLEKRKEKILTPKEELEHIRSKFNEKYFKQSKDYHRLIELANYWPQARKLLDRFHLEDAHNAQQAYRDVLEAFAKLIKGNLSPLTNASTVSNYLRARLEQTIGKIKPEEIKTETEAKPKVAEKAEETKTERDDAIIEKSQSEALKDEYTMTKRKTEQFKKNAQALKNLITCVQGTRHGKV